MSAGAALATLTWLAGSGPAWARFSRALADPAVAQARWLRRHLQRHRDTAYGREHGLAALGNYQEFARRVPVVGYDELQPWIDRIRRGEPAVLTRDPVLRLMPTSGSTSARKLIPFTASLQSEFNAALGPWLFDLGLTHPGIAFGPAYWSVTPFDETTPAEESAVPIGFADDTDYLGGWRARLVESAMAVPSSVRRLGDLATFRRTVLLHLLPRAELRLISVWHPSFLTLLLDTLARDWDALLAELPALTDARRLATLRAADPARPRTVWPQLRVVSCWADGHAAGPAAALRDRLPGVTVQPKGLLATEAFVTVPFRRQRPIALCSHFFEFITEDGAVLPIERLRLGQNYEVIVTTGGGLWRYRLGDRVEVTGFVARTPSLRFIGRAGNVSDLCGEKLSEAFVASVLAALCPRATFALLAPESDAPLPRYALFVEGDAGPAADRDQLDAALRANPHYALCRRLGQLDAPRIVCLPGDAYLRYARAETARGLRLGDIKPQALSTRTDWAVQFANESNRR